MRRIDADRGDVSLEAFTLARFLRPALDLKIWGFALIFFAGTTQAYALAYFLPIILRAGMGFSLAASQCLVAPPYAFAGIVMFLCGWLGDKYHIRGPIVAFNATISIIGLALMGWASSTSVRYFGYVSPFPNSHHPFETNVVHSQCIPHLRRCKLKHPDSDDVPSKQHSRAVEACFLQRQPCRDGWYRRHRWLFGLPEPGQSALPPWTIRLHCGVFAHTYSGGVLERELLCCEQEAG